VFRLRGKGVRTVRDARTGDLFATVVVETPVNLSDEQRELLLRFDELLRSGGEKHSPRAGGWLESVKRFFDRIKQ
jgi:molecular chaperone DnaJ